MYTALKKYGNISIINLMLRHLNFQRSVYFKLSTLVNNSNGIITIFILVTSCLSFWGFTKYLSNVLFVFFRSNQTSYSKNLNKVKDKAFIIHNFCYQYQRYNHFHFSNKLPFALRIHQVLINCIFHILDWINHTSYSKNFNKYNYFIILDI